MGAAGGVAAKYLSCGDVLAIFLSWIWISVKVTCRGESRHSPPHHPDFLLTTLTSYPPDIHNDSALLVGQREVTAMRGAALSVWLHRHGCWVAVQP